VSIIEVSGPNPGPKPEPTGAYGSPQRPTHVTAVCSISTRIYKKAAMSATPKCAALNYATLPAGSHERIWREFQAAAKLKLRG